MDEKNESNTNRTAESILDKDGLLLGKEKFRISWDDIKSMANNCKEIAKNPGALTTYYFVLRGGLLFKIWGFQLDTRTHFPDLGPREMCSLPSCYSPAMLELEYAQDPQDGMTAEAIGLSAAVQDLKWAVRMADQLRRIGYSMIDDKMLVQYLILAITTLGSWALDIAELITGMHQEIAVLAKDFEEKDAAAQAELRDLFYKCFMSEAAMCQWNFKQRAWDIEHNTGVVNEPLFTDATKAYVRRICEAARNARAWNGEWQSANTIPLLRFTYHNKMWGNIFRVMVEDRRMIVCSDQRLAFDKLETGVDIPHVMVFYASDIKVYNDEIIAQGHPEEQFVFPEGEPQNGHIYVQDPKNIWQYTELTSTNRGTFSADEVNAIQQQLKTLFYILKKKEEGKKE